MAWPRGRLARPGSPRRGGPPAIASRPAGGRKRSSSRCPTSARLELGRILHEEIDRLPGSYRAAVVACYLEGLTQAQAARQLRLAESTVRGRLAQARKLLGNRLTRRGIAPAVGLVALENADEASAPFTTTAARLPHAIVRSLARDALHFARSAGPATRGAVALTAWLLADGVLSTMWLPSLKTMLMTAALAAVGLGLTAATAAAEPAARPRPHPRRPPAPDPRPAAEPSSPLPQDSGEKRPGSSGKTKKAGPSVAVDKDLAKRAPGPIVRAVPVTKDCMILSYMPGWDFGNVDNFGIGNADGGNRTLIEWAEIPDKDVTDPDRRFLLAIYSRKTIANPPAGPILACEVVEDWDERTCWKTKPRYNPEPIATYKFEPGEGWKLFDVTPLVRSRAKEGRRSHGLMLRFLSEDNRGRMDHLDVLLRQPRRCRRVGRPPPGAPGREGREVREGRGQVTGGVQRDHARRRSRFDPSPAGEKVPEGRMRGERGTPGTRAHRSDGLHAERSEYAEDHALGVVQEVVVPDSKDLQSGDGLEIILAPSVWHTPIVMAPAIELRDQSVRRAVEVDNIWSDRMLAAEFHALQPAIAKQSPEDAFGDRGVSTKLACPGPHMAGRRSQCFGWFMACLAQALVIS